MRRSLRPLIVLSCALLLTTGLLHAPHAAAQADVSLGALTIELWPEYDRPTALVILRGTLASDVTLPASITVHLPAGSGGPSAVAAQQADGSLVNTQFVTSADGDRLAVTLQATAPSFQVEYYDPGLTIADRNRSFAFTWESDWSVAAATLRIQEPRGATDLTAVPPVTLAGSSDLGLNYHTASLGALTLGQAVQVELTYAKATAELSAEEAPPSADPSLALTVADPTTQASSAGFPIAAGDWRVWLTGALVIGVLGFAGWAIANGRRSRLSPAAPRSPEARLKVASQTSPRPMPVTSPSDPPAPTTARTAQHFCTQCGRPVGVDDVFCRKCGAPVRVRQRS